MTFIASVVAKKGVAIIADSLVTTSRHVIEDRTFFQFLRDKAGGEPLDTISIQPDEMVKLFDKKTSHTKDYEEKLFQLDHFSAITTAGAAMINGKRIEDLMKEMIRQIEPDIPFEDKVSEFCKLLNAQAIEHIKHHDSISSTTFIITHYNVDQSQTIIYKVDVSPCYLRDIEDEATFNCIEKDKMDDEIYKVVCDGQNRISERILWGEIEFFHEITPKIVERVIADLNIPPEQIPENYIADFISNTRGDILSKQFFDDLKISKLAELSLQQAVDLAGLLMTIEMNFQKYTENIPTVGGVIKLAVIDRDGFRWITGNTILKPETIH